MRFSLNSLNVARWLRKRNDIRVLVVECADFTDPYQATALLEANVPRKDFEHRHEVWRWNGSGGGIDDKNAYVLLKTGQDVVTPKQILSGHESEPGILFQVATEDVLFEVTDGKYVQDFRYYSDFHNLETFKPTFTGESARERYLWYSKVVGVGRAAGELEQNKPSSIGAKYWGVTFLVFSIIVSALIWFLV